MHFPLVKIMYSSMHWPKQQHFLIFFFFFSSVFNAKISAALIRDSQEPTKRDNNYRRWRVGGKTGIFSHEKTTGNAAAEIDPPPPPPFFPLSLHCKCGQVLKSIRTPFLCPPTPPPFFGGGGGGACGCLWGRAKLIMPGTASMSGQGEAKYIQSSLIHDLSNMTQVRLL